MNSWWDALCGDGFMPHGACYLWTPGLVWLHAVSDALIALAYFSIPVLLVYFIRKRRDAPFPVIFLMFGAFIIACGATHVLGVWTIWHGHYFLSGGVKAATAGVSLATAFVLVRVIPKALLLESPEDLVRINETLEEHVRARTADLEVANAALRREVAERESAEAEVTRLNVLLQRRVDELQALFDVLPVGVGIADDPQCHVIRLNEAMTRMLGLSPQVNASMTPQAGPGPSGFRILHAGEELAPNQLPMQVCAREGRTILDFEETIVRDDGACIEVLANAVPLRDRAGTVTGCVATFQDVTALKRAMQASARHAAFVAASDDAIIGMDLQDRVTDWNPGAERVFGYSAAEAIGQPVSVLFTDDARELETRALEQVKHGGVVTPYETARCRKDDQTIDVSIGVSAIRDEAKRITGVTQFARDISERKRAESQRKDMDRKIQDTQKLESLGVLAGGIAHDFNNLLTGILGYASLARLDLPKSSPAVPSLREIETAARRAADLCNQMLAYSGRGRFVIQELDLNQIISDTTHLLQISISKNCVLRLNLAAQLPAVTADATQVRQVIMNLVINASEAVGSRSGVVAITTGVARVDAEYMSTLRHDSGISPGDYVFFEVSDNGSGMDAGTLQKIFDPFFTTKFTGRGLGLAAVVGIVRGHKGALKVYSEPGRGTTFKIFLPCGSAPAAAVGGLVDGGGETYVGSGCVLVVDDEETVRAVAARMLEGMGFSVELANDGLEAVQKYRANPAGYDMILLDLTMPRLDGEETFRQMRHIRPSVRVLLMSGFNEHEAVGRFTGKGLAGFIQKPFEYHALAGAIRGVMLST